MEIEKFGLLNIYKDFLVFLKKYTETSSTVPRGTLLIVFVNFLTPKYVIKLNIF